MTEPGPDLLDVLYTGDPTDFVARRGVLVKELKAAGDKDLAALVTAARKPPKTAAALGRVARDRPEAVDQLFDAAALVSASLREGGDLRAAQTGYTAAVTAVVEAATELGDITSETMQERLRATVLAAGAEPDGEVARQLRAGAVRDDAAAPGFILGLAPTGEGSGPPSADPPVARPQPARPLPVEPLPVEPLADEADEATGDTPTENASGDEHPSRPARRLRSVRSAPTAEPVAAPAADEVPADDAAQLDAALHERERQASERAASEAEAIARRETMRRRRLLERDLDRIERRATRLADAADEAEERARAAREASDEASAELDELRSRLDDLDD